MVFQTLTMADATDTEKGAANVPVEHIEIDWATEPQPVFANYVYVNNLQSEVGILFCDVMPFPGRLHDEGRTNTARITASLRLPTGFFFTALAVLAGQWNKIAQAFLRSNPDAKVPRFTLIDSDIQLEGLDDMPR